MCIVFIYIMERLVSDIFSPCFFNNIMELTFIFSPRVFAGPIALTAVKHIIFNDL
jgi:hypothetical protein